MSPSYVKRDTLPGKKMHLCIFINYSTYYWKSTNSWATSGWICSGKVLFQGPRENKPQGIQKKEGKNMFSLSIF